MDAATELSGQESDRRRNLFYQMLRIRKIEECIADRYVEQEMRCPVHLSIGQEAVAVGVCAGIEPTDYVMSAHRAHAHYLAKGGSLKAMLAELYGRATGCSSGKGGSMHLVDLAANMLGSTPIVGSSLPVAVGAAFGTWLKGEPRVTVVFFGEAATEEGSFLESVNFAALKKLPILFVCENNLYSCYSSMDVRQSQDRDRVGIARSHGMEGISGDGNDIEEVSRMTAEAAERARTGGGPTFLEFSTYRWREHCGPHYDNHIGYRSEEEFIEWRKRCPIEQYRERLASDGVLAPGAFEKMEESIRKEIDAAFEFARSSPFPEKEKMFSDVYADA